MVYHFDFYLFQGPRKLSLPFLTFIFFSFTEATPTTCFSDHECIVYHNDQSGKATPIIPKINGEDLVSHSGTIIKFK